MKPHITLSFVAAAILCCTTAGDVSAQQYKLRQSTDMMGMKTESTIYVKGMRKRTESPGYMGMPNNLVTIEQCDKQRTITLNVKKNLYFIEPFSKDEEEVIDEDVKTAVKPKPVPVTAKKGGIITMYYNILDTGERKKMYGFTARHIWTTQKMKPSPDACSMKDSFMMKTDGWYIDLPEFNCPVRYKPASNYNGGYEKPDCQDRFVTRRSGKGKLGFPLVEKRTIIMGDGSGKTTEMVTQLETIELTTGKLDSMLFEIPPGYTEAKSRDELQDKFDPTAMAREYMEKNKDNDNNIPNDDNMNNVKKAGVIRIGVLEPTGEGSFQVSQLQTQLVGTMQSGQMDAVAVSSEEDARAKHCDLLLNTEFTRVKQAGKVGGILKAIKNADPNAASSYNIEASMIVTKLADGSKAAEHMVNGKYDGKPDDAARKALDEGGRQLLKALKL